MQTPIRYVETWDGSRYRAKEVLAELNALPADQLKSEFAKVFGFEPVIDSTPAIKIDQPDTTASAA